MEVSGLGARDSGLGAWRQRSIALTVIFFEEHCVGAMQRRPAPRAPSPEPRAPKEAKPQGFASFQFSPIPTSTSSGTLSVTPSAIVVAHERGHAVGVGRRRFEQQFVVHGEDHRVSAGASAASTRSTSIIARLRMSAAVP